ncbi:macro domain-containing protein [Ruminococcus sp.]|uniref:macro domain-containing protein n=1 Tax=Ruminococcus sp. TaxID=41978 RepID=UPI0025D123D2|nr:macro domain-containing protein [Ruminococcus sp.]
MMIMCIKNWASKFIIKIKRIPKKIREILKTIFAIIGILVTLADVAEKIEITCVADFYKKNYIVGLVLIILISIYHNRDKLEMKVSIADSPDVTITLKVCDALTNKGAVIIPTNTTFVTEMKEDIISKGSIQGQYQLKYFKNDLAKLDTKIDDGLKGKKYTNLKDGRKAKTKCYPIGTVCKISHKNKRAYFLASSNINAQGIPYDVDISSITQSLFSLWDALVEIGNHEQYSIPLLGTGKGRIKDASRDEVVRTIILTFLSKVKDHKITESLVICIHPNDYEKIHWDDLCEFLKHHSRYTNIKPLSSPPVGTEEKTPKAVRFSNKLLVDDSKYVFNLNPRKEAEWSDKEKTMVALLKGNEISKANLASKMGISMHASSELLKQMTEAGVVQSKGTAKNKVYFVPKEKEK